jgi:hypothetical protein
MCKEKNVMKKIALILFAGALLLIMACSDSGTGPEVKKDPVLMANKESIDLTGNSRRDNFSLMNSGGGQVEWFLTQKPEWISVSEDRGIGLTPTDTTTIRMWTDFEMLDYGVHTGQIIISSNAGTVTINLSLEYKAPLLKVDPALINLDRHYRFSDMSIINDGGGELTWQIVSAPSWLEFEHSEGVVYRDAEVVPYRANIQSIDYGQYSDKIIIESNGGTIEVNAYLFYEREVEVYPGDSAAGIDLGFTYYMVEKLYGKPNNSGYTRPSKTVFIHNVFYSGPGLEFRIKNSSPILFGDGAVGYIRMVAPYDGLTPENIGLGSTTSDLTNAYGEPLEKDGSNWMYEGIVYIIKNNKVSEMIIEEPGFLEE